MTVRNGTATSGLEYGSPPAMPDLTRPSRARLLLRFIDGADDKITRCAEQGWAVVIGQWVLWWSDDGDCWQHWPMHHVTVLEWEVE